MIISLENEFNEAISVEFKLAVQTSFSVAQKYGFEIFLIGGIVRDLILKNPLKDIDIAVQGDAVDFAKILEKEGFKILNIQENLRTAKVEFPNKVVIDFASTREENYIQSGVLPVAYNFGCTLEKDVQRRDFSINTLAMNSNYELVDYCSGYDDLANKKIRILHEKSFIDDPSRIIRTLKFKERFDFGIEDNTFKLLQEYLNDVNSDMPLERIKSELKQYFEIKKEGLYERFISSNAYKLISDNPIKEFDESTLAKLSEYELYDESEKWFLYIILLIVNSDFAIDRLNMNSFEKKILKETRCLLQKEIIEDKVAVYNLFNDLTGLSIAIYYVLTQNKMVKMFLDALKDIKILINGKDLIDLGLLPSSYFNKLFDVVLKEKLDGKLKTKEEEINFVKQFIEKEEG